MNQRIIQNSASGLQGASAHDFPPRQLPNSTPSVERPPSILKRPYEKLSQIAEVAYEQWQALKKRFRFKSLGNFIDIRAWFQNSPF